MSRCVWRLIDNGSDVVSYSAWEERGRDSTIEKSSREACFWAGVILRIDRNRQGRTDTEKRLERIFRREKVSFLKRRS